MARTLKSVLRAQGRLRKLTPVAIVDIGSNSVRLVVYEGLSRSPTPLFNEKVLAGLGRGIAATGQLDPEGVERALAALRRFRVLAEQAGADQMHVLATAAAREASNGPDFVRRARKILGQPIRVLTGPEEAYYAALGITCGFVDPHGVAADMGGGSVEFTAIDGTPKGEGITLPLGGLRLQAEAGDDPKRAAKIVRAALKDADVLRKRKGEPFYAVGGTWRAFGRLHMARKRHPLHIMHHYRIGADSGRRLAQKVLAADDLAAMRGMEHVSSSRAALLPYGAILLSEIARIMEPSCIIFSALGVREGYLFSLLPTKVQRADPLISAAEEMAVLRARSPKHLKELVKFTRAAFRAFGLDETADERRYRTAACLLADMTWRSHPDYRGGQALNLISNANFVGVDHPGRAYMALATFYRYEGLKAAESPPAIRAVASERYHERAHLLGALFRVAYLFSAAMPGVLPQVGFEPDGNGLALTVPPGMADFDGEQLAKRIAGLASVAERDVNLRVGG